jgi:5'-nucleotidase
MSKEMKQPLILVTNDDGITSHGIQALVQSMQGLGEVIVVAPDGPQSGMGHAITLNKPLRIGKVDYHGEVTGYQCSGTPVDCVKLAIDKILDRKPDLIVSGINHGSNSSINVIYSGTMSAAVEGGIEGIPSIGFSSLSYDLDADLTEAINYATLIATQVLKKGLPSGTVLNVNFPDPENGIIKGVKVCRQANAKWEEEFDERLDPHKRKYYWLTGKFKNHDKGQDTDEWALTSGFVSVVPVQFDLTAHHAIPFINNMDFT